MKTRILLLTLFVATFTHQLQAQNRTYVNAKNSEISDNLDLRAVASIFGDSDNLQDFERRLNDPKLQISNLDLNNDNQVDYLRVIESVEKRTHVVIIQAVLDRDVYQDVATIDVEKDRYNKVHIQIVGDVYMYGQNYIYEPVYYSRPNIYASFWINSYRPYCSSWSWNYYPTYYYTWNPCPIYRYRNNVHSCLNSYNDYNYVSYRRSYRAQSICNSRRSNDYEREYPDYAFSRRNSNYTNRYDLDQSRNSRNGANYAQNDNSRRDYSQNRTETQRQATPQRDYSQNRVETQRQVAPQRDYSQNRTETQREVAPQRDYSQNRAETQREATPQRDYSQNRAETQREVTPQRDYSQNRTETQREATPQRDYSQNRAETQRQVTPQKDNSSSRVESSERGGNRRG
jgi:hypothetical protein